MGNPSEQAVDSLNPKIIAATTSGERPPQMKPYCQLCFKEFNFLTRRYHCVFCTRSACSGCTSEINHDGEKERACEFCEVKISNPQIDQFYQLGKLWRQTDAEGIQKKIEWYKEKQDQLRDSVVNEREAISLNKEALERELVVME